MALGNRAASLAAVAVLAGCTSGSTGEPRQMASANAAPTPTAPASSAPSPKARASAASCFAPLPGHPTSAEKRAFVDEVSPLAVNAERTHGVPAAAVAAMAIQESGYGWTTLAQHTNDIMAWKYTTASAGGRDSWVLDCGTTKDRYIVFPDRAQAVDFVAGQLATSGNYAGATDRYRQERAQGAPAAEAIDRWVDDIADPYASQPEPYRAAIKRIMNNPLAPSDRRSPNENLYRLSESVQTARSGTAPAAR